jgi:hypothetical protein
LEPRSTVFIILYWSRDSWLSVGLYNLGSVPEKEGIFLGAAESRWAQGPARFPITCIWRIVSPWVKTAWALNWPLIFINFRSRWCLEL